MTQALMDIGPRVEPVVRPGKSSGIGDPADSGAAFADAVDQAVTQARDTGTDRASRHTDHESDRDRDHRSADEPSADGRESAAVWGLVPQPVSQPVSQRGAHGDAAETAGKAAAVGALQGKGGNDRDAAARLHTGIAADRQGQAPTGETLVNASRHTADGADATAAGGRPAGALTATAAAHSAAAAAAGTAAQSVPQGKSAAPHGAGADAAGASAAATAGSDPAATGPAGLSASRNGSGRAGLNGSAEQGGKPAPATGPERVGFRQALGATTGTDHTEGSRRPAGRGDTAGSSSATGGPSYSQLSASQATSAAAQAISPTAIHVSTLAATTVNSTPVATQTPTPMPFAQAQPDIAGILAQLRGAADGSYQLRARVHPAELGAVAISATVHHGALTVVLTPDQTAQQAISQSLTQLRDHLADQGFTGVNVGLGQSAGNGGQGDSNHAQGRDHSLHHGPDIAIDAVDAADALSAARRHSIGATALDRML